MMAAIAKSMTNKTNARVFDLFYGLLTYQVARESNFRKTLEERDRSCVITGTAAQHCGASHIIAHSLVRVTSHCIPVLSSVR
jgi:hypothetical protein